MYTQGVTTSDRMGRPPIDEADRLVPISSRVPAEVREAIDEEVEARAEADPEDRSRNKRSRIVAEACLEWFRRRAG